MEIPGYQTLDVVHLGRRTISLRARRLNDSRPVVVKTFRNKHPTERERALQRHAFAVAEQIGSDTAIGHLDLLEVDHSLVLVTDDIGGRSLAEVLDAGGPLTLDRFYPIAMGALSSLAKVHQKAVVHNDIKPANILWNEDTGEIRLLDFESCSLLDQEDFDLFVESEGTLIYMAPERSGRLNAPVDSRADLYSAGITFFELLVGQPPFVASSARELLHAHIAREPPSLIALRPELPRSLAAIVDKLLNKHPLTRYRSAEGALSDLEQSFLNWQNGVDRTFELATGDRIDHFEIPTVLYGREREIARLEEIWQQSASGVAKAVMVTGPAGIGKSSLVNELKATIVKQEGYFTKGKFDQFRRDVPYMGWLGALTELVDQLAAEPAERLENLKAELSEALGPNAAVLSAWLPGAKLLLGDQPEIPEVSPQEAQVRFNQSCKNFLDVVANPRRPVALFVDDLQWADLASLNLLESLLQSSEITNLLVIGAYRSTEVTDGHPLDLALRRLRTSTDLVMMEPGPLVQTDIIDVVQDTLHTNESIGPLSALVEEKTDGNPLYVRQFLYSLYRERIIRFDEFERLWRWDMSAIEREAATENVLELLARQMRNFPQTTQAALSAAACIGAEFDLATLAGITARKASETAIALKPALEARMLLPANADYRLAEAMQADNTPINPRYRFQHDRIQQGARDLAPGDDIANIQYRITLRLAQHFEAGGDPVDVMDHLMECVGMLKDSDEKLRFSRICLAASRQAKTSMATEPAWRFIQTGLDLCEAEMDSHHRLALLVEATDVAYISEHYDRAKELAAEALRIATTLDDRVRVHNALIGIGVAEQQHADAVRYGIDILKSELGVNLPRQGNMPKVLLEVMKTAVTLGRRSPESLIDLPEMTDPRLRAALTMMMKCATNAYWGNPQLVPIIAARMVQLSIRHGNFGMAAYGYALYGMILTAALQWVKSGYDFGQLALQVIARTGDDHLLGKTGLLVHAFIRHSTDPLRLCAADTLALFDIAMDSGDVENACYCCNVAYYADLVSGRRLSEMQEIYAPYIHAVLDSGQEQTTYTMKYWAQVVENLTAPDGSKILRGGDLDWESDLPLLIDDPSAQMRIGLVSGAAGWLAFVRSDWALAARHLGILHERDQAVMGQAFWKICEAMHAIVLIHERRPNRKLEANVERWYRENEHDFRALKFLVDAERAFVTGDHRSAISSWVDAAEAARETGFTYLEAWAVQRTADGHGELGHLITARQMDDRARQIWLNYGAHSIVGERWGTVQRDVGNSGPTGLSRMDFETVLDAVHAVSSSIETDALVAKALELSVRASSGQRGILLVGSDILEPLATIEVAGDGSTEVCFDVASPAEAPGSLVDYIARTRHGLLVEDAQTHEWLSKDPYVKSHETRSMLGLPLLRQGELVGAIVIENNLGAGLFSSAQNAIVETIAGQAAVSLENAQLFERQRRRAEVFRRFVPSDFLELLGRDIEDVVLGEAVSKDITVMFSDIRRFTPLSESLGAEQTFGLLNQYLFQMTPAIVDSGGFVDEFMGDGIKALFLESTDSALKAAIEMQRRLRQFNRERAERDEWQLDMGIGIHSGVALLGTIGGRERLSTKAIGDSVNVASRIEAMTKAYGAPLLISDETLQKLESPRDFTIRSAGRVRLIGRQQVVAIHEILDARPSAQFEKISHNLSFWRDALAAYMAGDFTHAVDGFKRCVETVPEDGLAAYFLARSREMAVTAPLDWEGVEEQDSK